VIKATTSAHTIIVMFFVVMLLPAAHASAVNSRKVRCGNVEQVYLYALPDKPDKNGIKNHNDDRQLPAVVLLHGAGDKAANMVDSWMRLAEKQQIVLLAPKLPLDPKFEDAAPGIFRCMVEDAKQVVSIDPQRVYLFGNSMGGYLAFDAAMFESQYFAAVAVHGNRIADEYTGIVAHAQRKTPIAIYIGDHDQFFSVQSVLQTRDLLLKSGFPVHYVEFVNHDHNYYAKADEINADAWKFMKANSLAK
jgi:poly(3-hydroxybutyrate) depolymerase